MAGASVVAALWYFPWLLSPARPGVWWLYAPLVLAELYNLVQASGFWWTTAYQRVRAAPPSPPSTTVDVFVPVYNEPVAVVEPTVLAARQIRGAGVRVYVLDDGGSPEAREMAARCGATYVRRQEHSGAKAGNINHALSRTSGEFVVVLDCDHVPSPRFCEATLGYFDDPDMAYVQTPQYYANGGGKGLSGAAWAQQALFFGAIGRGKDGLDSMFCCGTNVVFRRRALESVGGFPTASVTEDFQLSVLLHERGWRSAYVAEVLARGLGPEDMASYVSQQQRWARGCLSALPTAIRARLPWRLKLQYVLSSMFFLSGWTLLVYMAIPVAAILTGTLPIEAASADEFLLRFGPYWGLALATVAVAGRGSYTFGAFALWAANFWVHIYASVLVLLRRKPTFVVTPKEGRGGRQLKAVAPALCAVAVLGVAATLGMLREQSPSTLNQLAFLSLHAAVLMAGSWPALAGMSPLVVDEPALAETPADAATRSPV